MNANSSLHHIIAAYTVNGSSAAPSSQSANDHWLSETYVHPSWSAAEPACRNPKVFADMSLNEIEAEMERFWDIVDDRERL